ncbi:MAG: PEP-CTERM sorting domain-containing protein [Thermodesulfobacteriota bacterium]|nr:PEP-CTERM sorting domain-containing protein [Thermodesulfobacteriota bacterium]
MFKFSTKRILQGITVIAAITITWQTAGATMIDIFTTDDWITFADDDGIVTPGGGGQAFDENKDIYEYAFNFGKYTEGYFADTDRNKINAVDAGLYRETEWSNDIYFYSNSSPFAMKTGTERTGLGSITGAGFINGNGNFINNNSYSPLVPYKFFSCFFEKNLVKVLMPAYRSSPVLDSYWRTFSFNLAELTNKEGFNCAGLDVHWTMSCGNDNINASAPVPEPSTILIVGTGLAGLAGYRKKRAQKK